MATVRELTTRFNFKVDPSGLKKLSGVIGGVTKGFLKLGATAVGALAAIVVPAAALQDAVRDALTLTGETGKAFDDLEKGMTAAAIRLSEKLGVSAKQVAVGFYQVLSTGAKALSPEFNALAETALKMGKTVGLEPADAIERLNDTIKAFGLESTEAARVADVLFNTSKLAALTVPQLTEAMSIAAPAARTFGAKLETTSAALAALAEGGIKGARAGTGLQSIFLRLAAPTTEVEKALNELNVRVADSVGNIRPFNKILIDLRKSLMKQTEAQRAASLKALAGQEAFKILGTLVSKSLDTTIEWTDALQDSAGALDLAFIQKIGTAVERVKALWISVKNLAATAGGVFLTSLSGVADTLTKFTRTTRILLSLAISDFIRNMKDDFDGLGGSTEILTSQMIDFARTGLTSLIDGFVILAVTVQSAMQFFNLFQPILGFVASGVLRLVENLVTLGGVGNLVLRTFALIAKVTGKIIPGMGFIGRNIDQMADGMDEFRDKMQGARAATDKWAKQGVKDFEDNQEAISKLTDIAGKFRATVSSISKTRIAAELRAGEAAGIARPAGEVAGPSIPVPIGGAARTTTNIVTLNQAPITINGASEPEQVRRVVREENDRQLRNAQVELAGAQ